VKIERAQFRLGSPPDRTRSRSRALAFAGAASRLLLLLGALSLLALASCRKEQAADAEAAAEDPGAAKEFRRGPITVRLKTDRREMTIAERLELTLEAEIEEEYEVELPRFGEKLQQFGIVDYHTPQPKLVGDGKVVVSKSYVLEPFLSGDYKIPPMKLHFWKKGEEKEQKHEIETEELTVKVKSLLPETVANLKIADIEDPVELPRPPQRWIWWAAAGGLLLVAAVAAFLWFDSRRRPAGASVPTIAAHELAYRQLKQLVAEDLVAKGRVKLFYERISDILRHYIENRFGLHAPERTTEEFLAELTAADGPQAGRTLEPRHKQLLAAFLTHCDLVKFAKHEPDKLEIQKTFDGCKGFIAETELAEVRTALPPGSS